MSPLTRRQLLLAGAATAASAAASRALGTPAPASVPTGKLPNPSASGIEQIVVVCMENRSFDHYLGWLPGANGRQAGLSYPDDKGVLHPTHHLTDLQGCSFNDPDHSYEGGRKQLNGGRCDGFRKGTNDDFALGYYTKDDLPLYGKFVEQTTVFDQWYASILSSTYPNRFYTHAARTDRIDNATRTTSLPTIWDRLSAAGVPATYYFSDLPFLVLWGEKYLGISRHVDTFFADALAGRLAPFSYLDPSFLGEGQGGSNDDHPHADIRRGQAFLSLVATAIANSPQWKSTALVITYDEWGGFFDHVRPPRLPDDHVTVGSEYDHSQAGFRVPAFVFSPFARRGGIDHHVYDHTSILKFVEWRFGLDALSARDKAARNLAYALDFAKPNFAVPAVPLVTDPGPHVCGAPSGPMATEEPFWLGLKEKAEGMPGWRQLL
ncbi:MAG: alkaline phosphatase family protein [Frankiales bacterium]|nr:alkaline phosphatase family protein [Frankiales bacterium]